MKNKMFKTGRVVIALLFFVPVLCYFLDITGHTPEFFRKLLHIQLIPAIISGAFIVATFILLFTLLFGRIYCSTICPAGILQDIFIRLSGEVRKKKKFRFSYHKSSNIIRYCILGVASLLFILGSNQMLSLLDPYSNFGRISVNLLSPLLIVINNLIATLLTKTDNYSVYYISIGHVTTASLVTAIVILLIFAFLSVFRGRLFCNTLCPVGGLLSIFSRFSLFRITFNEHKCNQCGLCERSCKSECIESQSMYADSSRCISCFNCLQTCKRGALSYSLHPVLKKKSKKTSIESRRSFIASGSIIAASIPLVQSCKPGGRGKECVKESQVPITPPGAGNQKRFEDTCTACHLCIIKCPSKVLKPAGMQYGFDYFLKPRLSYEKAYCNYECTLCSDVCPNHALQPLTVEEKVTTQIGIVHFDQDICVVKTDEKDCGACSEHCPTQAVKMVPYKDNLRIPHIEPHICVGCGGCESICPVRPHRAIYIIGNAVHQKVKKPEYEKVEEVEVTDFGF